MDKTVITDFEAGVLAALTAIKAGASKSPGFNTELMEETAKFLSSSLQGVQDRKAFELALSSIIGDPSDLTAQVEKQTQNRSVHGSAYRSE
ncbi:hypothetical protein [Halomonas sp. OfavH-34-E]|uniref:hypothetical protein n=1 Tax=Halomonas sp. OfavH-34-E TaxID=2954491 RepID=UPI00209745F4|nr:hypothetical protein [Halomonas sp. OfavH-34-E]MCO7217826.1 hypothetical protein [Halomonas sp. OfavH-34-E]